MVLSVVALSPVSSEVVRPGVLVYRADELAAPSAGLEAYRWPKSPEFSAAPLENATLVSRNIVGCDASDFLKAGARGAVVLTHFDTGGCSFERKVRNCQDAGCVGVVYSSSFSVSGGGFFVWSAGEDHSRIRVPCVQLSRGDWHALDKDVSSAPRGARLVSLYDRGLGPFHELNRQDSPLGNALDRGLVTSLNAFNVAYAARNAAGYWKKHGRRVGDVPLLAKIVLTLSVAASTVRAAMFAVNLENSGVIPYEVFAAGSGFPFPCVLAAGMAITFYWWDALQRAKMIDVPGCLSGRSSPVRWIALGVACLYAAVFPVVTALACTYHVSVGNAIAAYVVTFAAVAIPVQAAYTWTGVTVFRMLSRHRRSADEERFQRHMIYKVVASGAFMLAAAVAFFSTAGADTPPAVYWSVKVGMILMSAVTTLHISIVTPRQSGGAAKAATSSGSDGRVRSGTGGLPLQQEAAAAGDDNGTEGTATTRPTRTLLISSSSSSSSSKHGHEKLVEMPEV